MHIYTEKHFPPFPPGPVSLKALKFEYFSFYNVIALELSLLYQCVPGCTYLPTDGCVCVCVIGIACVLSGKERAAIRKKLSVKS